MAEEFLAKLRREDREQINRAERGHCVWRSGAPPHDECGEPTDGKHGYCRSHLRMHVKQGGTHEEAAVTTWRREAEEEEEAAQDRANGHVGSHVGLSCPRCGAVEKKRRPIYERPAADGSTEIYCAHCHFSRTRRRDATESTPAAGEGSTTTTTSGGTVADDATTAVQVLAAWDTIANFAQTVRDQIENDAGSGWDLSSDSEADEAAQVLINQAAAKHKELDPMVEAAEGAGHKRAAQYQDA